MFSTVNYESATSLIVFSVAQSVYKYSHSLLIASHFFVFVYLFVEINKMDQQQSGSPSPRSPSSQPYLSVSVTDPVKLGNGVQAYISYRVITKVRYSSTCLN
jgi:hypothetical protein